MTVSIVEAWTPRAAELVAHLQGLADLHRMRELFVLRLDGTVDAVRADSKPRRFDSLMRAFESLTIDRVEVVTLVHLPLPVEPSECDVRRTLRELALDPEVGESLLLCPSADVSAPDLSVAMQALTEQTQRRWHRRLVLSPEDLPAPGRAAQRVDDTELVAHSATAAGLLCGALDDRLTSQDLGRGEQEWRAVRCLWRSVDVEEALILLASEVLDASLTHTFANDRRLAVLDDIEAAQHAEAAAQRVIRAHHLRFAPVDTRPNIQEIGLLAAIRLLWAFLVNGLRELPQKLVRTVVDRATSRLERAVSSFVFEGQESAAAIQLVFGGPDFTERASPAELLSPAERFRAELVEQAGPQSADATSMLPRIEAEPEGPLWAELIQTALSLSDGSGAVDGEVRLVPARHLAPELLTEAQQSLVLRLVESLPKDLATAVEEVAFEGGRHVALASADPWRLRHLGSLMVELAAPESPIGGESRELATALVDELAETLYRARQTFAFRCGEAILDSVADATTSLRDRLVKLAEFGAEWDGDPERRARRRVTWSFLGSTFGWVVLAALVVLGLLAAPLAAGLAVAVLSLLAGALIWTAIRLQRDSFVRQMRVDERHALAAAVQSDWTAVHRYGVLYRQCRDWLPIISIDLHDSVGRTGRIVVYGGRRTLPRWADHSTAISFDPAYARRLQRHVFQTGWRVGLHSMVRSDLLGQYQTSQGFDDLLDPFEDPLDSHGARQFLFRSYCDGRLLASGMKRRFLEEEVRDEVWSESEGFLATEHVRTVEGRDIETQHDSIASFLDLSAAVPFSAFLLKESEEFGAARLDVDIRRVERSLHFAASEHAPTLFIDDNDEIKTARARWPRLVTGRLDLSPVVVYRRPGHPSPLAATPQGPETPTDSTSFGAEL